MQAADICQHFAQCFERDYQTRLVGGASEPLYQPATAAADFHQVLFREDYAASALHEAAHWCIAGPARRRQTDYGYWYEGNRDLPTQRRFEQAEEKPQALEWVFSVAAGLPFRVSCDNFDPDVLDLPRFRQCVQVAAIHWVQQGLPRRADRLARAFIANTGNHHALDALTYQAGPP